MPSVPTVTLSTRSRTIRACSAGKSSARAKVALRSGTMSLAQAIARQGHNPDAVLAEIAAMNANIDALGLILDSDPRRVTKTGVMQADENQQN